MQVGHFCDYLLSSASSLLTATYRLKGAILQQLPGLHIKLVVLRRSNAVKEMAVKPITQFPTDDLISKGIRTRTQSLSNEIMEKFKNLIKIVTLKKVSATGCSGELSSVRCNRIIDSFSTLKSGSKRSGSGDNRGQPSGNRKRSVLAFAENEKLNVLIGANLCKKKSSVLHDNRRSSPAQAYSSKRSTRTRSQTTPNCKSATC